MSSVYDNLLLGKTSAELEKLSSLCISGKSWEDAEFVKELSPTRLSAAHLRDFEFGNLYPTPMDQFQYEGYIYHYQKYLESINQFFNVNFDKTQKAFYIWELNKGVTKWTHHLIMIYIDEKEWERVLDLIQLEKIENVYLLIYAGLLCRITRNLKQSLSYFLRAKRLSFPKVLIASCLMWMGDVALQLNFPIWSMNLYQDCVRIVDESAETFHWFVCVPFVYLRMAEIVFSSKQRSREIEELFLAYFVKSYREYDKDYKSYVQTPQIIKDHQQSYLGLRIARIIKEIALYYPYVMTTHSDISDSSESRNMMGHLQETYKRLALVYSYLKDPTVRKYVKLPRFSVETSALTIAEQLEIRKREVERIEYEENTMAPNLSDMNHVVPYMSLCRHAFQVNDRLILCELIEVTLRPSVTGFQEIPIQWYQEITSWLIVYSEFKQAQMTMGKCMLNHREYLIGWYVLLTLSIVNTDFNYIHGALQKLEKVEKVQTYWKKTLGFSTKFQNLSLMKSKL